MRRLVKILTSRVISIALSIIAQIVFLYLSLCKIASFDKFQPFMEAVALVIVIYIINKQEDPSYTIGWCVLILVFPVLGVMLYLLCAGRKMPKKLSKGTTQVNESMADLLVQDKNVLEEIKENNEDLYRVYSCGYLTSKFPVYKNTKATYFNSGEEFFPVLLEELRKAKHFIFLEFFIIDFGEMWDSVLAILQEKVKEGVEVKLIYDDFGCSATIPQHYDRTLKRIGIETYRFNKLRPALIIQMNNRDHRKVIVIDNNVAFTGGVNLADEYINVINRFGYWKDSAIRLEGEAVWSFTVMFLGMFSYLRERKEQIDYAKYKLPCIETHSNSYFQPFSDTPTDEVNLGLSAHLSLINQAKRYVYIDTPYLILNTDMQTALILAAQSGVDVRILVPHIPDKKYVFSITQSNYEALIKAGVRVYEFTPGFNHCKNIISDDYIGLVGTVNTDYRSYYLHFEDGVILQDEKIVLEMKQGYLKALEVSHEVTLKECRKFPLYKRIWRAVLKLMAPLF